MQSASHIHNLQHSKLRDSYLFISDLHLCANRPHITQAFLNFLQNTASHAKALYILGDLFEYWAGDDDIADAFHQQIIQGFQALASSGVPIFIMHGNRDFLIGDDFCKVAQLTLLNDPTLITLCGKKVLLSHGDDLCTDDVAYQQFRHQVRNKIWQADFLSQPLSTRKQQIEAIRARSEQEKSQKQMEIMDVNDEAVKALLANYAPDIFVHGHTHRPHHHAVSMNGKTISRWVLGDWYEQGSFLMLNAEGCVSSALE